MNQVNVTNSLNTVSVTDPKTAVTAQTIVHNVTVNSVTHSVTPDNQIIAGNDVVTVSLSTPQTTVAVTQKLVAVTVQPATIEVVTGGVQGPQGPIGLTGDELLLTKTERKDLVEDSPTTGDITIYYGTAPIGSVNADPTWLISRKILTKDGGLFDIAKLYASALEDQIWDNRLGLSYS